MRSWWRRWRERMRLRLRPPLGAMFWQDDLPELFMPHRERLHVIIDVSKELLQPGHPAVADVLADDVARHVHRCVSERVA